MDFKDTPEEAVFRAEVREWLTANAPEFRQSRVGAQRLTPGANVEAVIKLAKAWQARKADDGWACLTWPKQYGGRGAKPMYNVIWNQEQAKILLPPTIFAIGLGMAGPTIMAHATGEQKARYLPPMLRGEEVWCQLFSEPAAGSDLAGLRARAERDGDDWVINGQKVWTSGGDYSDFGILVVRSDPNVPKHKGLTFFIVDMK